EPKWTTEIATGQHQNNSEQLLRPVHERSNTRSRSKLSAGRIHSSRVGDVFHFCNPCHHEVRGMKLELGGLVTCSRRRSICSATTVAIRSKSVQILDERTDSGVHYGTGKAS